MLLHFFVFAPCSTVSHKTAMGLPRTTCRAFRPKLQIFRVLPPVTARVLIGTYLRLRGVRGLPRKSQSHPRLTLRCANQQSGTPHPPQHPLRHYTDFSSNKLPMIQSQVLDFTSAFPPAYKLTEKLMQIDYRKNYHNFVNTVVMICAFVAAISTVLYAKWNKYDCSERVQLFVLNTFENLKTFYAWMQNVFIPAVRAFYDDVRSLYNVFTLTF